MSTSTAPAALVRAAAGLALAITAAAPSTASAQTATVDVGNITLNCPFSFSCGPFTRTSQNNPVPSGTAQTVPASNGYRYQVGGTIRTTGTFATIIPSGSSIAAAFETLAPGSSVILDGYVRNASGAIPTELVRQSFAGTTAGITAALTLRLSIENGTGGLPGVAFVRFQDINLPPSFIAGQLGFNAGSFGRVITTPGIPVQTSEWQFQGDLSSVSVTGAGPGRMRYLDDPAFGTILGGPGAETTPTPGTPTGRTAIQSAFGTTADFGIPGPGGSPDTVYRISPARNTANPTNADQRRGIGLAVYPRTQPVFPARTHLQWTMVWDLYIPAASWTARTDGAVLALMQDNHNNANSADMFIRRDASGNAVLVYGAEGAGTELPLGPGVGPDRWFRLAVAAEGAQTGIGRVFVNGSFIGTTFGSWLYNAANPSAPAFVDGTAVPAATWDAWGQFPSPWASSLGGGTGAFMASTFCMFADLANGASETAFLANYAFTDAVLPDAQITALGGPNARGIFFLRPVGPNPPTACNPADITGIGGPPSGPDGILTGDDFNAFISAFAAGDSLADITGIGGPPSGPDGLITGDDFNAFIAAFASGCP